MRVWAGVLLVAGATLADEVTFDNGERLTGQVVRLTADRLVFRSELLGEVRAPWGRVRELATVGPVTIVRGDGSTLVGPLTVADGRVEVVTATGPVTLAPGEVTALNPEAPRGAVWGGRLASGLNSSQGNADSMNVNVGLDLVRRGPTSRLSLGGGYRLDRQKDVGGGQLVTNEDSWKANLRYDHNFSPRFFSFLSSAATGDRVRDLNARVITSGGIGYELAPNPGLSFATDWGVSWVWEAFANGGGTRSKATAQVGYRVGRRLVRNVEVLHNGQWNVTFDDLGDHLLLADAELRYYFTPKVFLGLSGNLDYDTSPAPGKRAVNIKYGGGFGWSF